MIKIKRNLIDYYGNPCGYTKNRKATVDLNFKCEELLQWLEDQKFEIEWKPNIFEKLATNKNFYEYEDVAPLKATRVWQLSNTANIDLRFVSYDEMIKKHGEPNINDYECVFDGDLNTNELEEIYQICSFDVPKEYKGHSLSMSDVVELYLENEREFFYVDKYGFKAIEFLNEERK